MSSSNVEAVGAMVCGCVEADDDDMGADVRTRESHGAGDRCGRRVVGTQGHVEMGKSGCI